jgi:hypothetical protein
MKFALISLSDYYGAIYSRFLAAVSSKFAFHNAYIHVRSLVFRKFGVDPSCAPPCKRLSGTPCVGAESVAISIAVYIERFQVAPIRKLIQTDNQADC